MLFYTGSPQCSSMYIFIITTRLNKLANYTPWAHCVIYQYCLHINSMHNAFNSIIENVMIGLIICKYSEFQNSNSQSN